MNAWNIRRQEMNSVFHYTVNAKKTVEQAIVDLTENLK